MKKVALLFTGQGFDPNQIKIQQQDRHLQLVAEIYQQQFSATLPEFSQLTEQQCYGNEISAAILLVSALRMVDLIRENPSALGIEGTQITAVAGHSVGQFLAFYFAGLLDREAVISLVFTRCSLLNEVVKNNTSPVTRLAVVMGLPITTLQSLIDEQAQRSPLYLSSINGNGHITIAGELNSLDAFLKKAKSAGAFKTLMLNTDGGWHSPFVKNACLPFSNHLQSIDLSPAKIDLYENTQGELLSGDQSVIKQQLKDHLIQPVQWQKTIKNLEHAEINTAIEVSDFNLLSRMGRYSSRKIDFQSAREILCVA